MGKKTRRDHRININFTREIEAVHKHELDRPLITSVPISSMQVGFAYTNATRKRHRVVRWREQGICKYILMGDERGRVLPFMRSFLKIRELRPKEKERILQAVKIWHELC